MRRELHVESLRSCSRDFKVRASLRFVCISHGSPCGSNVCVLPCATSAICAMFFVVTASGPVSDFEDPRIVLGSTRQWQCALKRTKA